ncbi:MAG: hypothetical protein R2752_23200 [Vicinamibacterales bacterium]
MRSRVSSSVLAMALAVVIGAGCGSKGGGPTTATPTVVSIQVNGSAIIGVGETITFSATAMLSNGQTRAVTGGAWGTDAPTVVSITAGGAATGLMPGQATIWVDSDGRRGTLLLTAQVSFTGAWQGNYKVENCQEDAFFAAIDFCATFGPATPAIGIALQQSGTSVVGLILFGGIQMNVAGSVDAGGTLRLSGTVNLSPGTIELQQWESRLSGTMMEGSFKQVWNDPTVPANASFNGTLLSLPKVPGSAVTAGLRGPSPAGMAPRDLLRRMLGR